MVIQLNFPAVHIVETHQKLHHRCLARACRTYDRNLLSRIHMCAEIFNNNLLRVVSKVYMFKGHFACHLRDISRMCHKLLFFLFL